MATRHASRLTHRLKMRWPLIFAASGALFLVAGASTVRESYREWKVDQEIRQMQSEIERLEGKKLTLAELIQRLDSSDAVDKEARTRLGLRKPGERVIILRGMDDPASWQDDTALAMQTETPEDTRTNARRWLDYFFPKPNAQ
ncbi:septum formation initiator family protein [Patescibacteria group bacterium]|jgi:cell division protein FtsB|nr:septum formation initiator family protein [Patescibacteria group bacterium]